MPAREKRGFGTLILAMCQIGLDERQRLFKEIKEAFCIYCGHERHGSSCPNCQSPKPGLSFPKNRRRALSQRIRAKLDAKYGRNVKSLLPYR